MSEATAAPPLFLIGARGTGKTTLARLLAVRLGWTWCDADVLLEQRVGKTIRAIFTDEGEPAFRDWESAILRDLVERDAHVIATGGGVVMRPENRELLRRGRVVWLRGTPAVLWQRLQQDTTTAERRPNLAQGGIAEIEALLEARTPFYASCADLALDTDSDTPDTLATRILAWLDTIRAAHEASLRAE